MPRLIPRANGPVAPVRMAFHYAGPKPCDIDGRAWRENFEAHFYRELQSVREWSARSSWKMEMVPALEVFVSTEYRISRALAHVWRGSAGRIEFPVARAAAGKAAVAHELVHVLLPNGNRFLAEGLAVYLQSEVGGNPAFPNFGAPLHELACERMQDMVSEFVPGDSTSLERVHIAELDGIATPSPLTLKVGEDVSGEEPRGQSRLYALAGSFVQFLIETRGLERFRHLYVQTPLVPLAQNVGSPERWLNAYGRRLDDLECEWKSLIAERAS